MLVELIGVAVGARLTCVTFNVPPTYVPVSEFSMIVQRKDEYVEYHPQQIHSETG